MTTGPMMPAVHLRLLIFLVSLAGLTSSAADTAEAGPPEKFRGSRVEWARLRSASPYWDRHANSDPAMLKLMREHTSLNMDHTWHNASAANLEELSRYPFIYADTIAYLSPLEAKNLAEYLRRGGFLLIDACRNKKINPNIDRFLQYQVTQLRQHFPDLQTGKLQPQHEIFSIYFKMRVFPPFRKNDGQEPLYAVFAENRMIAVISLNGFQCGWSGWVDSETDAADCMQMVTNIYIYAMTR